MLCTFLYIQREDPVVTHSCRTTSKKLIGSEKANKKYIWKSAKTKDSTKDCLLGRATIGDVVENQ